MPGCLQYLDLHSQRRNRGASQSVRLNQRCQSRTVLINKPANHGVVTFSIVHRRVAGPMAFQKILIDTE
ncbi:hypothetical protein D3C80_1767220 [compost metagenome]